MIGKYRVLEQIGEGGMATVYKAYDTQLEREVAIKMIRLSAFPPEGLQNVLKRFEREAKALARLSHTHIISVIDYGEHEGSPYLVMTYQPGGTLKQRLGNPMPWQDAARILLPVARALDYAHRQGVLHRDVKPANILLTHSGDPMLSDFGLAKILAIGEGHTLTASGISLGTPEYMAPEQGMGRNVDGRADVYSLGVVLYELVTGKKPFTADTPMAIIFKHISDPLPPPRKYVSDLPFEVEQVLFRALEKEPDHRYADMHAFAKALEQMASGNLTLLEGFGLPAGLAVSEAATLEPVDPSAPTQRDRPEPARTKKAVRRKSEAETLSPDEEPATMQPRTISLLSPQRRSGKIILGMGAVLALALVAWLVLRFAAPAGEGLGNTLANQTPVVSPIPQSAPVGIKQVGQLREIATLGSGSISQGVLSPAGDRMAVGTTTGVYLFKADTLEDLGKLETGDPVSGLAFSPDGKRLLVGLLSKKVQIWSVDEQSLERTLSDHQAGVNAVAFSSDGEHFASGDSDGAILIWRLSDMQVEITLSDVQSPVTSLAFSADGQKLAAGFDADSILIWAWKENRLEKSLDGHKNGTSQVIFSPDDTRLASLGADSLAKVWRLEDGKLEREIEGETTIACLAFSPNGENLLLGRWWDAAIDMVRLSDGELAGRIPSQGAGIFGMAVSPDGEFVYVWTQDGAVRRVRSVDGAVEAQVIDFGQSVDAISFSPDGTWLVTGGRDGMIRWWGGLDGSLNGQWQESAVLELVFAADGRLVSLGQDGKVRVWRAGEGTPQRIFEGVDDHSISSLALSPDGAYLATGQYDNRVYIRNFADGSSVQMLPARTESVDAMAFSPDGQWLATGGQDKVVYVWRVSDWQNKYALKDLPNGLSGVFFSPDSQILFANTWDGNGAAWKMSDGSLQYTFSDLSGSDQGFAISPSGEWLASTGYTRLRTWQVSDGGLVAEIPLEGYFMQTVAFSLDGAYLAVGEMSGVVHVLGISP